jgi:hypothetical protein
MDEIVDADAKKTCEEFLKYLKEYVEKIRPNQVCDVKVI